MNVYGVTDSSGIHTDTSKTLKGAKRYATNHGYTKVSVRYNCGYIVEIVAEKIKGKWLDVGSCNG